MVVVMSEVKPFIYAHELIDTVNGIGGIWLGCADEQSVKAAHIPGETGEDVIALYKSSDYDTLREDRDSHQRVCIAVVEERDTLRTANQRLEQEVSKLKAVMANQSARQFVGHDDQRHIDDLVAAGIRASDAEMKRLEGEVANIKRLLAQAQGMVNGATDQWHDDVRAALRGKGGGE
jgi:hypothetical protein